MFDPSHLPIIAVDKDLPCLSSEMLTADFLRACFSSSLEHSKVTKWQYSAVIDKPLRKAAVLLLFTQSDRTVQKRGDGAFELDVLMMRRSKDLRDHAGQICFPGGKVDDGDETVIATALRETCEEVGILPSKIEVFGMLSSFASESGFEIVPVVGLLKESQELTISEEVEEVFFVPLAFLMNPAEHRWHIDDRHILQRGSCAKRWLSMDYLVEDKSYFIWGITAAIVRSLYVYLQELCE